MEDTMEDYCRDDYFEGHIIEYRSFDEIELGEKKTYIEIIKENLYYFYNYVKNCIYYYIE